MAKLGLADCTTCMDAAPSVPSHQSSSNRCSMCAIVNPDVFCLIASRHEVTSDSSLALARATCHLSFIWCSCQLISNLTWLSSFIRSMFVTSTRSSYSSSLAPQFWRSSSSSSSSPVNTSLAQFKMPRFNSFICAYFFLLYTLLTLQSSVARQGGFNNLQHISKVYTYHWFFM